MWYWFSKWMSVWSVGQRYQRGSVLHSFLRSHGTSGTPLLQLAALSVCRLGADHLVPITAVTPMVHVQHMEDPL